MIDTDKYEGHTPAPWHEIFMQGDEYNNGYDDLQTLGFNEEAQDLIADAPLLLEAYRELQDYHTALLNWVMNHLDRDEDEVKEMIYE